MDNICDKNSCTGCMACFSICPKHAISMGPDEEGFLRPIISSDTCIDCGLCQKTCPVVKLPHFNRITNEIYSGWSLDEVTRHQSSSGGAFSEIATYVLKKKGVVFGCVLNDSFKAVHQYIDNLDGLERLRQSKYVQSEIGNSYRHAKGFLDQGKLVLFCGTPCQIAGLQKFLKDTYENLITVDIICHGVPSPKVFEDYKKWQIKKLGIAKIERLKFRDKKYSWFNFNLSISWNDIYGEYRTYIGTYYKDPFIRGFLRDYFLRPSCHQCKFTSTHRISDFTIADWWGYKRQSKKDKDYLAKGVSLIFANTSKASAIVPHLNMYLRKRTIEEAILTNPSLSTPFGASVNRNEFWSYYKSHEFDDVVKKYMYPEKISLTQKILDEHYNSDMLLMLIKPIDLFLRIKNKIVRTIIK